MTKAAYVACVPSLAVFGNVTLPHAPKAEPIFTDECPFVFTTFRCEYGTLGDVMSFTFTDGARRFKFTDVCILFLLNETLCLRICVESLGSLW